MKQAVEISHSRILEYQESGVQANQFWVTTVCSVSTWCWCTLGWCHPGTGSTPDSLVSSCISRTFVKLKGPFVDCHRRHIITCHNKQWMRVSEGEIDQMWGDMSKCTGHLNFFSEGVSSWPSPHVSPAPVELATLYLLWDGMSPMAGRGSGDVGGPHIWGYGLQRASHGISHRQEERGVRPAEFWHNLLISRVTVVIISLTGPGSGYFTWCEAAWKWGLSSVYPQFSLVLSPRQCLSLIFESCPNVRNQEGISRTLMYWQSLETTEQTEVIFHKISISPPHQHSLDNSHNNTALFKLELGPRHALERG